MRTSFGSIKLLTPTDCVKDRLAAYFYWDDYQSWHQALLVAGKHKIDFKDIRSWGVKEKQLQKHKQFFAKLKTRQKP